MTNSKDMLKNKIEEARFLPISENLFAYYDAYEQACREAEDWDTLSSLDFYRGETCFRLGRYEEAQLLINHCLLQRRTHTPPAIVSGSYNLLGLIYSAMGYEFLALDNYLRGLDFASLSLDHRSMATIQINIGWLYRDLGDYDKSLSYYHQAIHELSRKPQKGAYGLEILAYSYVGQIYFSIGRYQDGLDVFSIVENLLQESPRIFYNISVLNLYIRAYTHLHDKEKLDKSIDAVLLHGSHEQDFLEFSEGYLNICRYILNFDQPKSRQLLDILQYRAKRTALPFLRLKIQSLEVLYQQKYSSRQDYLEACAQYMLLQQIYDIDNRKSKITSMNNVEALRQAEKESARYLEQSRQDLMTGLLNKVSFEQLVSSLCESQPSNQPCTCAFAVVDLDHFKEINDCFGHMQGDQVLLDTVHYMRQSFDDSAILGRIGGDEFGIFWPSVNSTESILRQAEKLRQFYTAYPAQKTCCPLHVSVSIGISYGRLPAVSYQDLFHHADIALYEAKKLGRNRSAQSKVLLFCDKNN